MTKSKTKSAAAIEAKKVEAARTANRERNAAWRKVTIEARAAGFAADAGEGFRGRLVAFCTAHKIAFPETTFHAVTTTTIAEAAPKKASRRAKKAVTK